MGSKLYPCEQIHFGFPFSTVHPSLQLSPEYAAQTSSTTMILVKYELVQSGTFHILKYLLACLY